MKAQQPLGVVFMILLVMAWVSGSICIIWESHNSTVPGIVCGQSFFTMVCLGAGCLFGAMIRGKVE